MATAAPTTSVDATAVTLQSVVIPPSESRTITVGSLPSGTTGVKFTFTGVGQWRDTDVLASNTPTSTKVRVLEAIANTKTTNTITLPVPSNYSGKLTLTSTDASIRVDTSIVGYVGGTSTPAPAPSPAPAPTPAPAPSGTPGPDNTGVPAGVSLRVHSGDLVISQAGTVIDGLDIRGTVAVRADNVTIRNSIVRGKHLTYPTGMISNTRGNTGLKIIDTEIVPSERNSYSMGILGGNFTATRVDIHNVIDGVHINRGNVTIEKSWIHDNVHYDNDPVYGGVSHDDSIQIQAGSNIRITGNNIYGAHNTGIQLTQDAGIVSNVAIGNNHLDGGGCTVNLAEKGKGPFQGVSVTDNKFGRHTKVANCAIISPNTTKVVNTGNVYVPDYAAVQVRQG